MAICKSAEANHVLDNELFAKELQFCMVWSHELRQAASVQSQTLLTHVTYQGAVMLMKDHLSQIHCNRCMTHHKQPSGV